MNVARVVRSKDFRSFEELTGAAEGEREQLFEQLTPGKGRLLQNLIAIDRPRTRMPKPAEPQIAGIAIAGGGRDPFYHPQHRIYIDPGPGGGEFPHEAGVRSRGDWATMSSSEAGG